MTTQHMLTSVSETTRLEILRRVPKIRWWTLKGKNYGLFEDTIIEIGNWPMEEYSDFMWNEMSNIIRRVAKELIN